MFRVLAIILTIFITPTIQEVVETQSSGQQWDTSIDECKQLNTQNCGIEFVKPQPLISDGWAASNGSAPWNVAVYYNRKNKGYSLICGGTLISPTLVLSAAHCFTETQNLTIFNNNNIANINMYKIAVGKYHRNISIIDEAMYTQIIDVKAITMEPFFWGFHNHYDYDIAVIVLKSKVKISQFILPICIDWTNKHTVSNGSSGKIVGWGLKRNNELSNFLEETSLPYIDRQTCINIRDVSFTNELVQMNYSPK